MKAWSRPRCEGQLADVLQDTPAVRSNLAVKIFPSGFLLRCLQNNTLNIHLQINLF